MENTPNQTPDFAAIAVQVRTQLKKAQSYHYELQEIDAGLKKIAEMEKPDEEMKADILKRLAALQARKQP